MRQFIVLVSKMNYEVSDDSPGRVRTSIAEMLCVKRGLYVLPALTARETVHVMDVYRNGAVLIRTSLAS